ncbi:hypothetical protein FJW08_20510 [Mesorhizobium sp. B3-2-1]|uniref:hypothetical protein n=1 Tax=Mesorhizobium sp. B3-2-1 TaxID=2589891 RepID=UPI0011297A8E|nr:hypothetical protein [Mesorhizobium sp. B3-2-1]TPI28461.1 hypothetical protein FJW08_20510 [Mesorhizobium sp. B3-2-1]
MKQPKIGSKEWKGLIKSNVWGIEHATGDLVSVTIYNGGDMTLWKNGTPRQSRGHSGSRAEASTVFGLTDTVEISVRLDLPPAKEAGLRERSANRKAEISAAANTTGVSSATGGTGDSNNE